MSSPITSVTDPPPAWTGRIDGTGAEHRRWHQAVGPYTGEPGPGTVIIGFACDQGVGRNQGRRGAADGPDALRRALASLAFPDPQRPLSDAGTVSVRTDADMERGQEDLGSAVRAGLDAGRLPVVLGGGHEIAYGTYLGVAGARIRTRRPRLGILNVDAHFDLRADPVPSSGTPFRQILDAERRAGADCRYAVVGISRPSNTAALFDAADESGVQYLTDDQCSVTELPAVVGFVDDFLADVDLVYLTIDLDVLPAAVAPGVSAPAGYGVPLEVVEKVCARVAASGKLCVVDVAELNPRLDIDQRTARTAARLVHRIVTGHRPPD
ncbi:MAG: formimidoylglutamase [Gordonia sp. (in: high G+C Gram-positive bacteria)]|uniref:formimidoylglutamase n=1 Tax=Gordonia sp. (in: high G+C Gram-positive bacteria) TaxID=84139 RepID=UPI003C72111F